ncbi:MAG: PKD domain-containing protein [Chloroflexota bacterium]
MEIYSRRFNIIGLVCALAIALVYTFYTGLGELRLAQARPASAVYVVTTTGDAGPGSLRQAILDANASPGVDEIMFNIPDCAPTSPCIISLSSLLPVISDPLTITGPGMSNLIIDANNNFRGFNMADVPTTIADLTVQNGHTIGRGAGIRSFGDLTLMRVRLLYNQAEDGGGGVYADEGLTVIEGYFENNTSLVFGGGVHANSWLVLENSDFISNTANAGGGVYSQEAVSITGGQFERNNSGDKGGGLYAMDASSLTGTAFLSNTVQFSGLGGGAYIGGNAQLDRAWFEGNAAVYGGGLYVWGDIDLTDTTLLNNTAHEDGGGVFVIGNIQGVQVRFAGNVSDDDGGGILGLGSIHLVDSMFTGNIARNGSGGGIRRPIPALASSAATQNPTLALTRTQFISNTALFSGGGVAASTSLLVNSSTFVGNAAHNGGGVYHGSGSGLVVNSLFARNTAHNTAAALALDSSDVMVIKHATIIGDTGQNVPGITLNSGSFLLENTIMARHAVAIRNLGGVFHQDYNLFYQNGANIVGNFSGGDHNVSGDPKFVAPESGDFHIGAESAALDAGVAAGVMVDFEGDSRPLGSGFDIGFDEADLITGLAIAYSPSPTVTVQVPVSFTATVAGGSGIAYAWDFGDGSPAGSGNPISHSYTTPGSYTVTITATNSSGSLSTSVQIEVVEGGDPPLQYKILLPIILK